MLGISTASVIEAWTALAPRLPWHAPLRDEFSREP
jgi:hypothetical protein